MTYELFHYVKDKVDAESIELIEVKSIQDIDKVLNKARKLLIQHQTTQITVTKHD